MKITFEKNPNLSEPEILVKAPSLNEEVDRILTVLKHLQPEIIGRRNEEKIVMKIPDILYIESVDDKVFAYTSNDAIEIKSRLYELETTLMPYRFTRISISRIVNLNAIMAFKSSLNGRMEARLINHEWIEISRSYVSRLKQLLGGQ